MEEPKLTMYCPSCDSKQEVLEGEITCPRCGSLLEPEPGDSGEELEGEETPLGLDPSGVSDSDDYPVEGV